MEEIDSPTTEGGNKHTEERWRKQIHRGGMEETGGGKRFT